MLQYPHTKLFFRLNRIVLLSGPHIQVLDTHGVIHYSTTKLAGENEEAIVRSGPIRCSGISTDGRYLATAGDDKRLKIWDLYSLTLLSARALPKKPMSIEFSKNRDILVADKFGDVFRYALQPDYKLGEEKASDSLASHENTSGGELILGHASLLTNLLLTPDERFIITADRDEHIRVSWYPEGYNIESYCLGHTKYVSAIHIPAISPGSLISGGGDLELKVWDWMTGRLQRDIAVFAAVESFIKVKAQKRRGQLPCENDDDEEVAITKGGMVNAGEMMRRSDDSMDPEESEVEKSLKSTSKTPSTSETVLVVHRISSFVSMGETHVLFSTVGTTAIFEFALTETDDQPDIRHYDFGMPVIDFTVCGEGLIWVLLDANFPEESSVADERPRDFVQTIRWSSGRFVDAGSSALLNSLNTICSLPATAEDLKTLDLYSDLLSLPKVSDGEQGQFRSNHEPLEDEPTGEDLLTSVSLTKRALGRLKHKRALDQLHHEKVDGRNISGHNAKKMKADSDNEDSRISLEDGLTTCDL